MAPTMATPAHCARSSANSLRAMLQHPNRMSRIDANCHSNSVIRHGNSGQVHEPGYPFVEKCGLQLSTEEFGIVRVERRIQVALYGREINAVIFDAGVVSHHGEGQ